MKSFFFYFLHFSPPSKTRQYNPLRANLTFLPFPHITQEEPTVDISCRNITFSGSTTASTGTVLVSIYGWSENPLVEYYIQEYSNSNGAAQGTQVGTVVSDGSTYNIWKHQQVGQPSIEGTSTFWQVSFIPLLKHSSISARELRNWGLCRYHYTNGSSPFFLSL